MKWKQTHNQETENRAWKCTEYEVKHNISYCRLDKMENICPNYSMSPEMGKFVDISFCLNNLQYSFARSR